MAGIVAEPLLEELQRGCVGPLQIIEEQHQRVLGLGEDAQELRECHVEAVLGLDRPDLRHRRLRDEDALQLGQYLSTMRERAAGTSVFSSSGGRGRRAMCAWTSSIGSLDANGGVPVSIWNSVTPIEQRSDQQSTERPVRPVCSGAI